MIEKNYTMKVTSKDPDITDKDIDEIVLNYEQGKNKDNILRVHIASATDEVLKLRVEFHLPDDLTTDVYIRKDIRKSDGTIIVEQVKPVDLSNPVLDWHIKPETAILPPSITFKTREELIIANTLYLLLGELLPENILTAKDPVEELYKFVAKALLDAVIHSTGEPRPEKDIFTNERRIHCERCLYTNPVRFNFCWQCGERLPVNWFITHKDKIIEPDELSEEDEFWNSFTSGQKRRLFNMAPEE